MKKLILSPFIVLVLASFSGALKKSYMEFTVDGTSYTIPEGNVTAGAEDMGNDEKRLHCNGYMSAGSTSLSVSFDEPTSLNQEYFILPIMNSRYFEYHAADGDSYQMVDLRFTLEKFDTNYDPGAELRCTFAGQVRRTTAPNDTLYITGSRFYCNNF